MAEIKEAKISDLVFDDKNFNRHTEYGMSLIEKSIRNNGAGRSILIDKNNRIIAGNGVTEIAGQIGLDDVQIVESDGTKIIAVKRTDIDLDSKQGREMALADNATASVDLAWDMQALQDAVEQVNIKTEDWGVICELEPVELSNTTSEQLDYFKFKNIKVPLTDDEVELLQTLLDEYSHNNGTYLGFINNAFNGDN